MNEPHHERRKSKKDKRMKSKSRVYKKGGKFRTQKIKIKKEND